jgi:hypothetical protein
VDKIIYLVQTMGLDSEDAYLLMEDKWIDKMVETVTLMLALKISE